MEIAVQWPPPGTEPWNGNKVENSQRTAPMPELAPLGQERNKTHRERAPLFV